MTKKVVIYCTNRMQNERKEQLGLLRSRTVGESDDAVKTASSQGVVFTSDNCSRIYELIKLYPQNVKTSV
jgi:hypothetical protein